MARRDNAKPMIRILLLGAPGVGKSCLESRFTTGQWPPSYDPSLTICSRRFYTFQYSSDQEASIAPTSPSASEKTDGISSCGFSASSGHSSTTQQSSPDDITPVATPEEPDAAKNPFSVLARSTSSFGTTISEPSFPTTPDPLPIPCTQCIQKSQTYLVEIINYPSLRSARVRHQVHLKGEYDAILFVYDIGNRDSFDHIKTLHAEIPRMTHPKRRKASSTPRCRGSVAGFRQQGNGAEGTGGNGSGNGGNGGVGGAVRSGGPVVGIVGNRCDVDGGGASTPPQEQGLKDEDASDLDYALALFRHPLICDEGKGSESLGRAASPPQRPALKHLDGSSDTPSDSLQHTGGNLKAAEATTTELNVSSSRSGLREAVHRRRQVSYVEGEALALDLAPQVPFFETSARTGENVEEAFEATARAVLKETGRDEINFGELAKRCLHRHHGRGSHVSDVAPRLELPALSLQPASTANDGKITSTLQLVEARALGSRQPSAIWEQPVSAGGQQSRKRESMVGRMRKMFRKQPPAAETLVV